MPPVSQTLPATPAAQPTPVPAEVPHLEKPQSNGTPEEKAPAKGEIDNHVPLREKSPQIPTSQTLGNIEENSIALPEQKPAGSEDSAKIAVDNQATLPTPEPVEPQNSAIEVSNKAPSADNVPATPSGVKSDVGNQQADTGKSETVQVQSGSPTKEKEQPKTSPAAAKAPTTPRTPTRKSKTPKPEGESPKAAKNEPKPSTSQKSPSMSSKSKRTRIRTQPYQSPLPEIEIITKITASMPKNKNNDDKLIVFYKNEFLAVRNSEGSFYICQAVQNIYKSSPKIRIRWLSQDKSEKSGEIYTPDFYDNTGTYTYFNSDTLIIDLFLQILTVY